MIGVNKVTLVGHLTKDPDLKNLDDSKKICRFTIVTGEMVNDQSGGKREKIESHHLVLFDRLAEIAHDNLKKGMKIYVEGRMQTKHWIDKESINRNVTEVVVINLQYF